MGDGAWFWKENKQCCKGYYTMKQKQQTKSDIDGTEETITYAIM